MVLNQLKQCGEFGGIGEKKYLLHHAFFHGHFKFHFHRDWSFSEAFHIRGHGEQNFVSNPVQSVHDGHAHPFIRASWAMRFEHEVLHLFAAVHNLPVFQFLNLARADARGEIVRVQCNAFIDLLL